MTPRRALSTHAWVVFLLFFSFLCASTASAQSSSSTLVTWTCAGTICPWGPSLSGEAVVWPVENAAQSQRYDYTTSHGIYLPADPANRLTVTITSGSASLYAGPADDAQSQIASLAAGQSHSVDGLLLGDVLSVQSGAPFTYTIELAEVVPLPPVDPALETSGGSNNTVWSCAGVNCPWGGSVSGHAIEWPAEVSPSATRYDYVASYDAYLSDDFANGLAIRIDSGTASLFRGTLYATDEVIVRLEAGDAYIVSDLAPGEVLSVEGGAYFTYTMGSPEDIQPGPVDPGPVDPGPVDPGPVDPGPVETSELVTWTCDGTLCPWGASSSGQALVWPAEHAPESQRYDYTTSDAIYLPADPANRLTLTIASGSASLYAGRPEGEQALIATLSAGQSRSVDGLTVGDVLSVQGSAPFTYTLEFADAVPLPPVDPALETSGASKSTVWSCEGANCPWGGSVAGHSIEWPAEAAPSATRYDYVASHAAYLSADFANGLAIRIDSGVASFFKGTLSATDEALVMLDAGNVYVVSGLAPGEVLSVEGNAPFTYTMGSPEDIQPAPVDPGPVDPGPTDPGPGDPGPGDPDVGDPDWAALLPPGIGPFVAGAVASVDATWQCDTPDCTATPRTGAVLDWPEWSAYASNGHGDPDESRAVYDGNGSPLHPFMGRWADGCNVTAEAGNVLVIEWQRGAATRRETWLAPGESHQIALEGDENGAVIESGDGGAGFAVSLAGCQPNALPDDSAPEEPVDPGPTGPVLTHAGASQSVVWTCSGTDCPWGGVVSAHAAVWPAEAAPLSERYDYDVSHPAYLTADVANGIEITVESGAANVFVGTPQGTDDSVAHLTAGESYVVAGLTPGDVLSLESANPFTYRVGEPAPPDPNAPIPIESVAGYWYCDTPGCSYTPWSGRVIDWTHWSAYPGNARSSELTSRVVFDANGEPLHPYMGEWANGCTVRAETGRVLIIEWQRGADIWRETYLDPGESRTITLVGPEDGALIESNDINDDFSVTLENCEPQPLQ